MTWEKALAFIKAIANGDNHPFEINESWSPMLVDGYQTKAGYYRLTNGSNFDLEIPALGVVASAQSLAKSLEDWMDISLTELLDIRNELEIHLEVLNKKIYALEYQGVSTHRRNCKYGPIQIELASSNSGGRAIPKHVGFNRQRDSCGPIHCAGE
jgi:hypothetical protein